MEFPEAMRALIGAPHLMAIRKGGPILQVSNRNKVVDVRNGNERTYVGKLSDYVAIDWQVMTVDQFRELIAAAVAARDQA